MRRDFLVSAALALLVFAAMGRVLGHDFVTYDDPVYVTQNAHVRAGLSASGVVWAFRTVNGGNWHPLTWLSHMLDCETFGLSPGGHHFTSLVLHAVNSVLLFLLLGRITSAPWRSAFVASLFAVHPLHVESVAWVAERKDVLSTLFWVLAVSAYAGWTVRRRAGLYGLSLALFAFGLMAKPMVVTLPFVLLLLDYWPLRRMEAFLPGRGGMGKSGSRAGEHARQAGTSARTTGRQALSLVLEKSPFFLLGGLSSLVTYLAQSAEGAVATAEQLPLALRLENGLVSYVRYLAKTAWPRGLVVYYEFPSSWPAWQIAGSAALIVLTTALALRAARARPYLVVGWLWFLVTLVPVIGLVQVGSQAMADRYTYVPLIGIFMAFAWGVWDLAAGLPMRRILLALFASAAIAAAAAGSYVQAGYWKNGLSLFTHAAAVSRDSAIVQLGLGNALAGQGRTEEAVVAYREAVRLVPGNYEANSWLGNHLMQKGDYQRAAEHYAAAARARPEVASAHNNLGVALAGLGRAEEAIGAYSEALRRDPEYVKAYNNLAVALAGEGRTEEARSRFFEAIRLDPDYAEAHANLGGLLLSENRIAEAAAQFREALRTRPGDASVRAKLKTALARLEAEKAARNAKDTGLIR